MRTMISAMAMDTAKLSNAVAGGRNIRYILLAILLAAVITFVLRALPFLIFNGERRMPEFLVKLGTVLPAAIMAVLIVYCVKDAVTDWRTNAIPQLLAVLTVGISYKWKHNTLISIIAGTAVYMLLLRIL